MKVEPGSKLGIFYPHVSSLTRPLPKSGKERGTHSLSRVRLRPAVHSRPDKLRGTRPGMDPRWT